MAAAKRDGDTAAAGPSGADTSAAPAASSDGTRRTPVVLTSAADVRGNSFPPYYKARPKRRRAKDAKKKGTDDPLYEVSLGTESDDFSGQDPDPNWWIWPTRSEPRRERETRASTVTQRKGRSPPPGFSWKSWQTPQQKPKRSRNASRKHSAGKRKQSVDKKDL